MHDRAADFALLVDRLNARVRALYLDDVATRERVLRTFIERGLHLGQTPIMLRACIAMATHGHDVGRQRVLLAHFDALLAARLAWRAPNPPDTAPSAFRLHAPQRTSRDAS